MRSIIRVEHNKDRPYLLVSTELVRDHSMSFNARGFLVFLLAKADDWRVRPEDIAKECGIGVSTVYRYIEELITAGYIRRDLIRIRKAHGYFASTALYTIYESKALCRDESDRKRFTSGEIEQARLDALLDGVKVPF